MAVTVKFFASLREQMNCGEQRIDATEAMTVQGVWAVVAPTSQSSADILAAVNLEYVEWTHPVADGDEVAFFPPVTGG
ncbi:MAG: molybdopterin converting factor subunit 1 [Pseudomonadota bacterium]